MENFLDEKKEETGIAVTLQQKYETFAEGARAFLGRDTVRLTIENSIERYIDRQKQSTQI